MTNATVTKTFTLSNSQYGQAMSLAPAPDPGYHLVSVLLVGQADGGVSGQSNPPTFGAFEATYQINDIGLADTINGPCLNHDPDLPSICTNAPLIPNPQFGQTKVVQGLGSGVDIASLLSSGPSTPLSDLGSSTPAATTTTPPAPIIDLSQLGIGETASGIPVLSSTGNSGIPDLTSLGNAIASLFGLGSSLQIPTSAITLPNLGIAPGVTIPTLSGLGTQSTPPSPGVTPPNNGPGWLGIIAIAAGVIITGSVAALAYKGKIKL